MGRRKADRRVTEPPPTPRNLITRGLCGDAVHRGTADPNWWTPDPPISNSVAKASQWCSRCPVQEPCFMFALLNPTVKGVYGGHPFNLQGGRRKDPEMSHDTYVT